MKLAYSLVLIGMLGICCGSIGQKEVAEMNLPREAVVALSFQLIDDEIDVHDDLEATLAKARAEVTYRNDGKTTVVMPEMILSGHKSDGFNHIEVQDLGGQTVAVDNTMDYDLIFDPVDPIPKEIRLRPGEVKVDTIDLNTFYRFAFKGEYKVRFVDTSFGIQSNWDTLLVK